MSNQVVPTKSQLLATKKSLKLSKKVLRFWTVSATLLVREIMSLLSKKLPKFKIESTLLYEVAYEALEMANITLGNTGELASTVPFDDNLNVAYRSVMGVEPDGCSRRF